MSRDDNIPDSQRAQSIVERERSRERRGGYRNSPIVDLLFLFLASCVFVFSWWNVIGSSFFFFFFIYAHTHTRELKASIYAVIPSEQKRLSVRAFKRNKILERSKAVTGFHRSSTFSFSSQDYVPRKTTKQLNDLGKEENSRSVHGTVKLKGLALPCAPTDDKNGVTLRQQRQSADVCWIIL